ncbi:hypothetical protein NP233_g1893 [Leucocoprinus birnbaumii]|uniref:HTH CENPB-type domain-containing protein n=1 Tax=Leucocoprinus birnbaumii TaxID=56174 RepID=A0AAD5VZR7_9AGAR|nr:hypothetical protein NP233_g1893 [Leucocoprinus birnbaumii]
MTPSQATRKPRPRPGPYKPRKKTTKSNPNAPKTSAQPSKRHQCSNLTLHDWLTVFAFVDEHPDMTQQQIADHFAAPTPAGKDGNTTPVSIFSQETLSRKLKMRPTLMARANKTPNALSSKRPHVVTPPDVEMALFLWIKHMEEKGEHVSGPMLIAKRKKFEEDFNVPEAERLQSETWVSSFCSNYKMKEYKCHGEARSVDHAAVMEERKRVQAITALYEPKDRFNFDETGFFPFCPPERGLATKQMSGKKKDKFRISVGVACNADGTEKLPLFFIGKSKKPKAFNGKTPEQKGFYYRNNKKAWMTKEIFEEWIKQLDIKMRRSNREILLLIDGFSAHYVDYEPRNIRIEFFSPNLTSHVQPCDAGIIRCLKAHYRRAFCERAIKLDEVGESDIYKINIHEAMLMIRDGWDNISSETIEHCWTHTRIQPTVSSENDPHTTTVDNPITTVQLRPSSSESAQSWDIIREFATTPMTMPEAQDKLRKLLGEGYREEEWIPAFDAIFHAEGDVDRALDAIDQLVNASNKAQSQTPAQLVQKPKQLQELEKELLEHVGELQARRRMVPLTLEEMLNPVEERQVGESEYRFEGGDDEIIRIVKEKLGEPLGAAMEVEDSDDEDEEQEAVSKAEVIKLSWSDTFEGFGSQR